MFDKILTCSKSLSDYLQHSQVDLAKATDLISATVSTFQVFRTDDVWDKQFSYAKNVAEINQIPITTLLNSRF